MDLIEQEASGACEVSITRPFALILAPTRELALQISNNLKIAAAKLPINVVPIVGGMAPQKQERLLRKNPEIIVGTPGRLWNLFSHEVRCNKLCSLLPLLTFPLENSRS